MLNRQGRKVPAALGGERMRSLPKRAHSERLKKRRIRSNYGTSSRIRRRAKQLKKIDANRYFVAIAALRCKLRFRPVDIIRIDPAFWG